MKCGFPECNTASTCTDDYNAAGRWPLPSLPDIGVLFTSPVVATAVAANAPGLAGVQSIALQTQEILVASPSAAASWSGAAGFPPGNWCPSAIVESAPGRADDYTS